MGDPEAQDRAGHEGDLGRPEAEHQQRHDVPERQQAARQQDLGETGESPQQVLHHPAGEQLLADAGDQEGQQEDPGRHGELQHDQGLEEHDRHQQAQGAAGRRTEQPRLAPPTEDGRRGHGDDQGGQRRQHVLGRGGALGTPGDEGSEHDQPPGDQGHCDDHGRAG